MLLKVSQALQVDCPIDSSFKNIASGCLRLRQHRIILSPNGAGILHVSGLLERNGPTMDSGYGRGSKASRGLGVGETRVGEFFEVFS